MNTIQSTSVTPLAAAVSQLAVERLGAQFERATGISADVAEACARQTGIEAAIQNLDAVHDTALMVGPWLMASDSEKGFWCSGFGWCSNKLAATGYSDDYFKAHPVPVMMTPDVRWVRYEDATDYPAN